MSAMESVAEVTVDTRSKGCYLKETSNFHMNLPGLNIGAGGKKELYVNVTDFKLPPIEKSISFVMYYGFDTHNLCRESPKEYTFVFSSLNQFAQQLRCAVFNDFLYKSKCVKKDDESLDGNVAQKDDVVTIFSVRYEDGMFELQLDEHCAFFGSMNLFEFMGFKEEVADAMNRENEDKVMAPECGAGAMKICKRLTCGVPRQFFSEVEGTCHLVIDKCVEPTLYFNGCKYGIVCSYDLSERKITSHYKRFDHCGMQNIRFSLLNNDFKAFNFGCCLKNQSLRFVLNVVKKI